MRFLPKTTLYLVLITLLLLYTTALHAAVLVSREGIDSGSTRNLIIRQLKEEKAGVLVSKPAQIDLRIANIIRNEKIDSIQDYAEWLEANIRYRRDGKEDVWAHPNETLKVKYGDCEDIAFLNQAFLRVLNCNTRVIALVGGLLKENHAVCIFQDRNQFYWFDNASLKPIQASTFQSALKICIRNYLCRIALEIKLSDRESTDILAGALK